ncbi:MAG: chromate transporter [Rubrivivax sp.]|jgi:chromate transporter|nr:chromate transporter [Rubrivivax sp.]
MPEPAPALQRPASPAAFFWACTWLALQGFGGVLPVAQRELVERRCWLTREQFLEQLSLSQVLPGPNIVNLLVMLGDRLFGWRGAVAGGAGILLAPLLLVLVLAAAVVQWQDQPLVTGALRGMGIVAAGLVLSTAFKLVTALRRNALGSWLCAAFAGLTLLAVGGLRWPLASVVLGLGVLACVWAWFRLEP